ncbi:CU044_5270 family protein [Streptomyces sp. NPDC021224]|uniref:CU044_5270 family protein n=1 Tax=unclassified Streptomyces TaxID=2593676 RepID=UPI0037AA23D7
MDEMTALRELRTDAPVPDAARLAAGRWKLMSAALSPDTAPAPRWRRAGHAVAGTLPRRTALAALTAAAVTAGVLVAGGGARSPGQAQAQAQTETVAQVLEAAATQARSEPSVRPDADQWVYAKSLACPDDDGCTTGESWVRGDGSRQYRRSDRLPLVGVPTEDSGSLSTYKPGALPQKTYDLLATLPTNPRALLDRINHDPYFWEPTAISGYRPNGLQTPAVQFARIETLLTVPEMPAATKAALFRALPLIPGLHVSSRPVKDAAGRTAIAVQYHFAAGAYLGFGVKLPAQTDVLYFDPHTHAYLGQKRTTARTQPFMVGTLDLARLATGVVDHIGQLPGQPDPHLTPVSPGEKFTPPVS